MAETNCGIEIVLLVVQRSDTFGVKPIKPKQPIKPIQPRKPIKPVRPIPPVKPIKPKSQLTEARA